MRAWRFLRTIPDVFPALILGLNPKSCLVPGAAGAIPRWSPGTHNCRGPAPRPCHGWDWDTILCDMSRHQDAGLCPVGHSTPSQWILPSAPHS